MPKQKKRKLKTTFKTLSHQWNTNECKQEKNIKSANVTALTLKFNWTKLQHTLLQLDTMSLRKLSQIWPIGSLVSRLYQLENYDNFCNCECLWKRPQIQACTPPPPLTSWRIICLEVQKLAPTRSFVSHSLILYLCNCLQQHRHEKWVHRLAPIESL